MKKHTFLDMDYIHSLTNKAWKEYSKWVVKNELPTEHESGL